MIALLVGEDGVGVDFDLAGEFADGGDGGIDAALFCDPEFEAVDSDLRVAHPQVRGEAGLATASWSSAMAITEQLVTDADTVALLGGARSTNEGAFAWAQLADAIGHDARIGRKFLNAGIGFGGGCLPKDIRGFVARADELGVGEALAFLTDVDEINMRRRGRVTEILEEELGDLKGKKIAVWGLAFKPDSDDIRDSPALDIVESLARAGATVIGSDPEATGPSTRRIDAAGRRGSRSPRCRRLGPNGRRSPSRPC